MPGPCVKSYRQDRQKGTHKGILLGDWTLALMMFTRRVLSQKQCLEYDSLNLMHASSLGKILSLLVLAGSAGLAFAKYQQIFDMPSATAFLGSPAEI